MPECTGGQSHIAVRFQWVIQCLLYFLWVTSDSFSIFESLNHFELPDPMDRLVLPVRRGSHKIVYDEGRGFLAVGIGDVVSLYRVDSNSITLACSFATNDGPCTHVRINKNRLTDKVYILVAGATKLKGYALAHVESNSAINPLTFFDLFELSQTVSDVVWDPRNVDSALYCTRSGVLYRLTLGLESTSKYRIEILHEFHECVRKIVFSPRNPRFCFCQTDSDLVAIHEADSEVKFRVFGIRGLVDFDVSAFGYLAGVTDAQLTMFDIGMFNCKSFDNKLFDSKVIKSVRTELKGMKRIFCDKKLPNLMFAKQTGKDNDFFMQLSMDPKCEKRFCVMEPNTVFIAQQDGRFICGTDNGVIYVISIGTMFGVTARTTLQAMSPKCLCDVQNEFILYEDYLGKLVVSQGKGKEIDRVFCRSVGQISKLAFVSDDNCFVVLADGKLKMFSRVGDSWFSKTMLVKGVPKVLTDQPITNFWIERNQLICVQIGKSICVACDLNETMFSFCSCNEPRSVAIALKNGVIETAVTPNIKNATSCVTTKHGTVYYIDHSIIRDDMTTTSKVKGDLIAVDDDNRFAVVSDSQIQYFSSETLQPDGPPHNMPARAFRSIGSHVYCLSAETGLSLSLLNTVVSDFVKSDEFEHLDSPILVLSSEDMSKTIAYSLGLFAIFDPESPEVDEIGCLSKTEVERRSRAEQCRELSVDELQRKIFARLGPISADDTPDKVAEEVSRKVATGGQYRRAAILQHTFRKFDEAVDYLLQGKIYELANLYVKLYEINGKDTKIISCAVNEMIEVGDYIEAYQVLKAKQCYRGCLYIRKILGMYELITDEMLDEAKKETVDSIEIEDEIKGMLSLDEIREWRDKCMRGEFS